MAHLVENLLWQLQRPRTVLWGGRPGHDTQIGGLGDRVHQRTLRLLIDDPDFAARALRRMVQDPR